MKLTPRQIAQAIFLPIYIQKKPIPQISQKLWLFLRERKMSDQVSKILIALNEVQQKQGKEIEAQIESARPLNPVIESEVKKFLKKRFPGFNLKIQKKLNPNLLGGVKIITPTKIFDLSLLYKIREIKRQL